MPYFTNPLDLATYFESQQKTTKNGNFYLIFIFSTNSQNSVDKLFVLYYIISVTCGKYGGIAQLARAIGSYPAGHKFKSYCRYQ